MKFYALIAAMLLSGSIAFAHTDPIVMIIDGQSVKKSEFEYFYQKNHFRGNTVDSKSVKVFADGFVNYKLKVQAAKDAHLDTLLLISGRVLTTISMIVESMRVDAR